MKYILSIAILFFGSMRCMDLDQAVQIDTRGDNLSLSALAIMQKRWSEDTNRIYDSQNDAMNSLLQKQINQKLRAKDTPAIEKWLYFLKPENQGSSKRCISGFYTNYAKKKHFFTKQTSSICNTDILDFSKLPSSLSEQCINHVSMSDCCAISVDKSFLVTWSDKVLSLYDAYGTIVFALAVEFSSDVLVTDITELMISPSGTTIGLAIPEHDVLFVWSIQDMLDHLSIAKIVGQKTVPCSKIQSHAVLGRKNPNIRLSEDNLIKRMLSQEKLMSMIRLDAKHLFLVITPLKRYVLNTSCNAVVAEYDTVVNCIDWVEIDQKQKTITISTKDGLKKQWNARNGKFQGNFLIDNKKFFYDYEQFA